MNGVPLCVAGPSRVPARQAAAGLMSGLADRGVFGPPSPDRTAAAIARSNSVFDAAAARIRDEDVNAWLGCLMQYGRSTLVDALERALGYPIAFQSHTELLALMMVIGMAPADSRFMFPLSLRACWDQWRRQAREHWFLSSLYTAPVPSPAPVPAPVPLPQPPVVITPGPRLPRVPAVSTPGPWQPTVPTAAVQTSPTWRVVTPPPALDPALVQQTIDKLRKQPGLDPALVQQTIDKLRRQPAPRVDSGPGRRRQPANQPPSIATVPGTTTRPAGPV